MFLSISYMSTYIYTISIPLTTLPNYLLVPLISSIIYDLLFNIYVCIYENVVFLSSETHTWERIIQEVEAMDLREQVRYMEKVRRRKGNEKVM